jgi:branched-chain amino acid transport system permease protein
MWLRRFVSILGRLLAPIGRPVGRLVARLWRPFGRLLSPPWRIVVRCGRLLASVWHRYDNDIRLLGCCLAGGAMLAIITGPDGSGTEPLDGLKGSLISARVWDYLIFGLALWLVMTAARKVRNGELPAAAAKLRGGGGTLRTRWDSMISSSSGRRFVGSVSLVVCLLAAFALANLLGPFVFDKWSLGNLGHQLPYPRTYAYLVLAVAFWAASARAILDRRGLRGTLTGRRRVVLATVIVVGSFIVAYGGDPWLPTHFHWSNVGDLFLHWPTYGWLAGGCFAARGVLVAPRVASSSPPVLQASMAARGRQRRFLAPGQAQVLYIVALFIAIEAPKFLAAYWQDTFAINVGIYALLALGLNVVVGFAGLLDLGYVAFYAVGAYVTAYLSGALPIQPPHALLHLNPFLIVPLAILAAMGAGILLGLPTLRLRGDYLAIVTLGFGEIIYAISENQSNWTGGGQGTTYIPPFSINFIGIHANFDTPITFYYVILVVVLGVLVLFNSLNHSKVGRTWAAIREDEAAAESLGINGLKYKVMAFAIGASTGGFAGVFEASTVHLLYPSYFVLQVSILVLAVVIFGGMGSLAGVLLSAVIIEGVPFYLKFHPIFGYTGQDLFLWLGAILILMMIFRPQGLIPSRRREREINLAEHGLGHADSLLGTSEGVLHGADRDRYAEYDREEYSE